MTKSMCWYTIPCHSLHSSGVERRTRSIYHAKVACSNQVGGMNLLPSFSMLTFLCGNKESS